MNGETYDAVMDYEAEYFDVADEEEEEEEFGEEVEEMLDTLGDSSGEDYAERRRRRRARARAKARTKTPVRAAAGRPAYQTPATQGFVTQKQLKDALTRVGADINRNAQGIKQINTRVNGIGTRLDGVVSVNRIQSREIAKIDKRMKIDGALELVESFSQASTGAQLDTFQLFKGVVKSGWLGESKAMTNPLVVGGIGLALRSNLLQNVVGGTTP